MLRIAAIGARGMLGADFTALARSLGCEAIEFDLPGFDIRRRGDARRAVESADVVANFAAYTDVDGAEKEKELCFAVNAEGAGILAEECARASKYLLHVSTDFVFGDRSLLPLKEDDETCPLNAYGESKLEGERLVLGSGAEAGVIRLEWTYGINGRNFVSKILSRAQKNARIKVVDDQVGSPTWTLDASHAAMSMIRKSARGIFHFAPLGYASRWELAKFAVEQAGIGAELLPCRSSEFKMAARRPMNSRFDCSRIDGILDRPRQDWRESLRSFIGELKKRKMV